MNGPSDELVKRVQALAPGPPGPPTGTLRFRSEDVEPPEKLVADIVDQLGRDVQTPAQTPADEVAAAQAWAYLASQAAQSGGTSQKILKKLLEVAQELSKALSTAVQEIGADSFSVSAQVPWGVGVTISWAAPKAKGG